MNKIANHHFQDEDLEKSAPILFNLKRNLGSNAGFQVPEGYFDGLSSEVMHKIESMPDLESSGNMNPFNTPGGYFDALPTIIQQRIADQEKKRNVTGWIAEIFYNPVPKYTLAFVSIFLILFFSIKYFNRTQKVEYVNSEHETEQLESFYLSQLDETVLLEAYAEEQVTENEMQESEIENYLLENNIDLNLISEQLQIKINEEAPHSDYDLPCCHSFCPTTKTRRGSFPTAKSRTGRNNEDWFSYSAPEPGLRRSKGILACLYKIPGRA
jgi:hypothetical protein